MLTDALGLRTPVFQMEGRTSIYTQYTQDGEDVALEERVTCELNLKAS